MTCSSRWLTGAAAVAVLGLFLLSGCGNPNRPGIDGTVTFNNEPVDGGSISFLPEDGSQSAAAEIKGGKYSIPSGQGPKAGPCKVQIYWNKKTGKKVDAPGDPGNPIDETKQVIPGKYNTETTLSETVKTSGNTFNFDLKPK